MATDHPLPTPQSVRALAEHYVNDLNFSVVPLKPSTKGPPLLSEWTSYTKRRPSKEELDTWFGGAPRNVGVVCGLVSGSLTVVDFDDGRAFRYCFAKHEELSQETILVETGRENGGFHVYMLIRGGGRPRNYTLRQQTPASTAYLPVEVKGEGSYVVAPCSVHASGKVYAFIGQHDELMEIRQGELDQLLQKYAEEWPVVERVLGSWRKGSRHDLVLGLVKFLRHEMRFDAERTEQVIIGIGRAAGDGTLETDRSAWAKEIRAQLAQYEKKGPEGLAAVKFLGDELYAKLRPLVPKRPSAQRKGKSDREADVRYETYLELADGRIAEEIITAEGERFVLYDPAADKWEIVPEVLGEGETIRPRLIIQEERTALTIADGVEEYESAGQLLEDMERLALTIYDPGAQLVMFRVWLRLALCSWIVGELTEGLPERYAPILDALGPPEAGKGRLLTVCRQFFYRSILFQKTKRVPSIFRTLQPYHHATLLLEEADLDESTESSDLVEFLNSRASGHPAVRWSSETERANWFLNFGYTLLAIRRPYEDAGLTSRTIPFLAESTTQDLPLVAPAEFASAARAIVRKLLLWRLRHVARIRRHELVMPTSFKVEGMDGAHRVRGAFLPLLSLRTEEPALIQDVEALVRKINERVVVDRAESFEGQLLNLVYNVLLDDETRIEWASDGYHVLLERDVPGVNGGPPETEEAPLHARWVADRLNRAFDPHLITQAWRGFGQAIKARDRIGRRRYGSLLVVADPARLCRLFTQYVPGSSSVRDRFKHQISLDAAPGGGPNEGG